MQISCANVCNFIFSKFKIHIFLLTNALVKLILFYPFYFLDSSAFRRLAEIDFRWWCSALSLLARQFSALEQ